MSLRIALDNAPEFYTNLDVIQGRIVLGLTRHEQIGAIVVKLEGESRTALAVPANDPNGPQTNSSSRGEIVHENHKILYKFDQVFPEKNAPPLIGPIILAPGQHEYPFRFKVPFNNACSDPDAMVRIGGMGPGGFGSGPGIFGLGGIRVMDGSKQLLYSHVTKTLPPSFTGFPRQAEIRYYIKVTIQRPGLFKENWRYHIGFKFLPIEPLRPPKTNQEAYARRPFAFRPRSPASQLSQQGKRSSFFAGFRSNSNPNLNESYATSSVGANGKLQAPSPQPSTPLGGPTPPSIEMSARLPHPTILTCNKPIDLRVIAKKLVAANEEVYLTSLQIDLIGSTVVRCQDLVNTETTNWVVVSRHGLSIPVSQPGDAVGTEVVMPGDLWRDAPLPNTVMPSFVTCNLSRNYQLEVKIGLSWGKPMAQSSGMFKSKASQQAPVPQVLHLPLHFSTIEVYSGLAPPKQLVEAMRHQGRARPSATSTSTTATSRPPTSASRPSQPASQNRPPQPARPPRMPPRPTPQQAAALQAAAAAAHDPLYPPQLAPGQTAPAYDDAPPSYDEAMADAAGPVAVGEERPAYSGVTNENGPSTIPGGDVKG